MWVRFTETRVVQDGHEGTKHETRFDEGSSYDLPEASAQRWIKRDVAVAIDAPEPDDTVDAMVAIPENWRDQHHSTRRALARAISDADPASTDEADTIIAAEVERRAEAAAAAAAAAAASEGAETGGTDTTGGE